MLPGHLYVALTAVWWSFGLLTPENSHPHQKAASSGLTKYMTMVDILTLTAVVITVAIIAFVSWLVVGAARETTRLDREDAVHEVQHCAFKYPPGQPAIGTRRRAG